MTFPTMQNHGKPGEDLIGCGKLASKKGIKKAITFGHPIFTCHWCKEQFLAEDLYHVHLQQCKEWPTPPEAGKTHGTPEYPHCRVRLE